MLTTSDKIENVRDRHCPQKSWGWEEWIVNNDLYCGKRLHFTSAYSHTSLHFHIRKHETMYVESGIFEITTVDPTSALRTRHVLTSGNSIVIEPGMVHRITCMQLESANPGSEAVLVEFSTHHEDSDSYRVEL